MRFYLLVGGSPVIVVHPASQRIAVGNKVTVMCQATGATPLIYTWLHNGSKMIPARNEKNLVLDVKKYLSGEYLCYVENEFGSMKSESAKLIVGKYNPFFFNGLSCLWPGFNLIGGYQSCTYPLLSVITSS